MLVHGVKGLTCVAHVELSSDRESSTSLRHNKQLHDRVGVLMDGVLVLRHDGYESCGLACYDTGYLAAEMYRHTINGAHNVLHHIELLGFSIIFTTEIQI